MESFIVLNDVNDIICNSNDDRAVKSIVGLEFGSLSNVIDNGLNNFDPIKVINNSKIHIRATILDDINLELKFKDPIFKEKYLRNKECTSMCYNSLVGCMQRFSGNVANVCIVNNNNCKNSCEKIMSN